MTEAESAAGEESAAIAVLQTSVEHNNESLRRLEQELTSTDQRRENLQGQIDGQLARIADIDRDAAVLETALSELLSRAQALAGSAKGGGGGWKVSATAAARTMWSTLKNWALISCSWTKHTHIKTCFWQQKCAM